MSVTVDGVIATPRTARYGKAAEEMISPDAIADTYWHLHTQDRCSTCSTMLALAYHPWLAAWCLLMHRHARLGSSPCAGVTNSQTEVHPALQELLDTGAGHKTACGEVLSGLPAAAWTQELVALIVLGSKTDSNC